MRVRFRQLWFCPDGKRYRPGIHEVPDKHRSVLPSTSKVISITLKGKEAQWFVETLDNPPAPSPVLKALLAGETVDLARQASLLETDNGDSE